jgi:hypothetical protein
VRLRGQAPVVTTLIVTALVLGPLWVHGGIALRGDMVFTPDQPWKPAWLGLDGSVPRAVPMDALVSVVDNVVPGALLQRLVLTVALVAGGAGIARLAGRFHVLGQVAAVVVYLWNPWVHERLAIGQWPTVLGYGLLPWLVLASARARDGRPGGWPAVMVLLVLTGACAPSVGLVGALVAVIVVAAARIPVRVVVVLLMSLVANLPWIVPALLAEKLPGTKEQFSDFTARGETPLGTLASLLSMGGIWKSSIVPPERTHVVVVAVAGLLAVSCLASLRSAAPLVGRRTVTGVAGAGFVSLLVALLPTIGPVGRALGSLSTHWFALGIIRDSHRYLAPLGLALALGAAALVERLVAGARTGQPAHGAIAGLLVVAPVLLLPSLAWGLAGDLRPVEYPRDWTSVAARVASGGNGATVVLPWTGSYRGYGWNDHRAVLDPAARFLPGDVLVDDRVFLRDRVLPGEDPVLARVGAALDGPDPDAALGQLGVRWVLVEKENGVHPDQVPSGESAYDGRWLGLIDLGPPEGDLRHWRSQSLQWTVVLGDAAVLLATCVSILELGRVLVRTRR